MVLAQVAGGAIAYIVVIVLILVLLIGYFVVRAKQPKPPLHAAQEAREGNRPHEQDPIPSNAQGFPFRNADGTPLQPGDVDTADAGGRTNPPESPEGGWAEGTERDA